MRTPSVPPDRPRPARRSAAWRRASAVRSSGIPTVRRLVEPIYVGVLVVLVVGAPAYLWLTRITGPGLGAMDPSHRHALGTASTCLVLAGAALFPVAVGPVRASLPEIAWLIDGAFGVRRVVAARTLAWFAVTITLGAMGGSIAAADSDREERLAAIAHGVSLGLAVGTIALASALVRSLRSRIALTVGSAALGVLVCALPPSWVAGVLGVLAVAGGGLLWGLLERVSSGILASGARRRAVTAGAVLTGDLGVAVAPVPSRFHHFRSRSVRVSTSLPVRTMLRDGFGLARLGTVSVPALLCIALVGSACVLLTSATVVAIGSFVVQLATGVVMTGFRQRVQQVGADDFESEPYRDRLLWHLPVPLTAVVVALAVGALVAALADGGPPDAAGVWAALVALGVQAVGARVWLACGGSAPVWTLSPVATPLGDFAGAVFLAWVLRGALPSVLLWIVGEHRGLVPGVLAAAAFAILMAWLGVAGLVRTRRSR